MQVVLRACQNFFSIDNRSVRSSNGTDLTTPDSSRARTSLGEDPLFVLIARCTYKMRTVQGRRAAPQHGFFNPLKLTRKTACEAGRRRPPIFALYRVESAKRTKRRTAERSDQEQRRFGFDQIVAGTTRS